MENLRVELHADFISSLVQKLMFMIRAFDRFTIQPTFILFIHSHHRKKYQNQTRNMMRMFSHTFEHWPISEIENLVC